MERPFVVCHMLTSLDGKIAVSYTHLDVYKRQMMALEPGRSIPLCWEKEMSLILSFLLFRSFSPAHY